MGDVPWKGQHGAKRLVKEFRHISEQIEKGMLPQISNLSMHQVGATALVSNERPRRLPLVPDRIELIAGGFTCLSSTTTCPEVDS